LHDWHDKKLAQFIGKPYKPRVYKDKPTYRDINGKVIDVANVRKRNDYSAKYAEVVRRGGGHPRPVTILGRNNEQKVTAVDEKKSTGVAQSSKISSTNNNNNNNNNNSKTTSKKD
jgi:hypothetical protein